MNPQDKQPDQVPSLDFIRDVFGHLPVLIVQLNVDGIVQTVNPETSKVTGYKSDELVGRNWWGTMFPGKLFRQVPKFVSAAGPNGVLRDVPMAIRTKEGRERTIAWTRFTREVSAGKRELVLIGLDLTDRLTDADRQATDEAMNGAKGIGDAVRDEAIEDEVDGVILPIAASPPRLSDDHGHRAIQEVHEFLTLVDARIDALEAALMKGELGHVAALADQLRHGAHACGLLHVSGAANRLLHAASQGGVGDVTRELNELVGMCRQPTKQA